MMTVIISTLSPVEIWYNSSQRQGLRCQWALPVPKFT